MKSTFANRTDKPKIKDIRMKKFMISFREMMREADYNARLAASKDPKYQINDLPANKEH